MTTVTKIDTGALLAALTPVLDDLLGESMAEHFSCIEADNAARLFVAAGRRDDAALFVRLHAVDDDEGDPHAPILDAYDAVRAGQSPSEPDDEADEARARAARAYVAQLVAS